MAEAMVCLLQGSLSVFWRIFVINVLGKKNVEKKERRDLSPPTQTGDSADNVSNWLWAEG